MAASSQFRYTFPKPFPKARFGQSFVSQDSRLRNFANFSEVEQTGFQARPVVGGLFMKMLANPAVWHEWASRER